MTPLRKKYNYCLFRYGIFILMLAFLFSCATVHNKIKESSGYNTSDLSAGTRQKIKLLRHDLTGLGGNTDPAEAKQLAETSICYSLYLAGPGGIHRPGKENNRC